MTPSPSEGTDPARQREAALREVLDLISRSRRDAAPVFDAILHRAARLCGADSAALILAKAGDTHQRMAASLAGHPETIALYNRGAVPMNPDISFGAKAILTGKVVHVHDMMDTENFRNGVGLTVTTVKDTGVRTIMFVPLVTPSGSIGAFSIYRREVRPFSPDEIALLETFAAQAVIAIENVRQFGELQTRLAREKASAEILEVISQSRDDDRPVFDVVLRKAAELCHASMASLNVISEDRSHAVAVAEWGDHVTDQLPVGITLWPMDSDHAPSKCMREGRIVHVHDLADTDLYRAGDPIRVTAVDAEGIRTFLAVPLFSGGRTVSCISIYRREVRPFTPDEIALVETFAAQAVIAFENVRQFRELQASLEQQEATSDILRVISQSREDETQVFDLILEKAAVLCDADQGSLMIVNEARTHVRHMADWGHERTAYHAGLEYSLDLPLSIVPTVRTAKVVHIEDYSRSDAYRDRDPIAVNLVETEGHRTRLVVPLLQNGIAIGCIALSRRVVRSFTPDEIALVETFAAQAVIAIENVRQFRELQTRLAREAATREILEVISQSRDDDKPVFDVVLRKAAELCHASLANLNIISDDRSHAVMVADWGDHLDDQFPLGTVSPMEADYATSTCMREGRIEHFHDLADTDLYRAGDPLRVATVDAMGIRTFLAVPLFSGDRTVGCISVYRREVRSFTPDEIALVETFAAQAVIAIENVRQFRELQTRLAREAATREILEVISQSRDDDKPVFDVVLRKAADLCHTPMASLFIISEDRSHAIIAADLGLGESVGTIRVGTTVFPLDSGFATSTCMREGRIVHLDDMADSDLYRSGEPIRKAAVDEDGLRTLLAVPMFGGGRTVGCISVYRREVKPFSLDEIALVETFAAQAVIAIENVRQFRELQTRLAREAATREILEVISRNPDDDRPVFDVIMRNAIKLCAGDASTILMGRKEDPRMTMAAWRDRASGSSVMDDAMIAQMNATDMLMDPKVHVSAQAIIEARNIHILDVRQNPSYLAGEPSYRIVGDALGVRSSLVVPLIDAKGALGVVHVYRREVRPFTPDEIALVETFAAQAVIAIENVRQFREVQTRLEREAATREILSVISQSRNDDGPVFEVIAQSAARLCRAANCTFWRVENGLVEFCASYGFDPATFADESLTPDGESTPIADNTLIGQVVRTRAVARIEDGTAESYLDHKWVRAHGLKYLIGVPIFVGDTVWGSINLMWPPDRVPRDEDIHLVEGFAAQASIAIENVRQFRALEVLNAELGDRVQDQVGEIERMGRLKRFLPSAVADAVVSSGSERMLKSHRALLGVLFCDIRGFTAFCETAEPEETIEVLQTYHEEMGRLIEAHGAGVDHRMGDGIMVLFNDPLPCDDPAGAAVRLAMAMRSRMAELCARWKKMGHRLGFGVGISLGYATVGMVGSGGRQDYTASGTAVNLAARLCDEALDGEILISPRAATAVEGSFAVQGRGERNLKGIREPVELFRVAGAA